MFARFAEADIRLALEESPAVAILGPRQIGKTTLAQHIANSPRNTLGNALYLDLESPDDRAKLAQPIAFFKANRSRLLVLDEVQNMPDIFGLLRGEIDADRRAGRFLMLGSASYKLLRQSESLAGRLAMVDMAPLLLSEVWENADSTQALWLRGGFPPSFTARSNAASMRWRSNFIRHFLNTDLPALGIKVDPEAMRRFWRMLAHLHGQLFNASTLAASLGVSAPTATRWAEHLSDTLMLLRLEPYHANLGKRLVKSPKYYVRDSGLLHALLGINQLNDLFGHPSAGASWEGFCVEQICAQLPADTSATFYRTAAGAELDLVLETPHKKIGVEIKLSTIPKVTKGFWQACTDVGVDTAYIICPVADGFAFAENVDVVSPLEFSKILKAN